MADREEHDEKRDQRRDERHDEPTVFRIARDPAWRLPLLIIGATEARSVATLEPDAIDLRFGFTRVRVPYAALREVRARPWSFWLGLGIRIDRDATLGLVGSTRGVVNLALKEPTVEGVLFMRHPRNVAVSLEDPEGFVRAVRARMC